MMEMLRMNDIKVKDLIDELQLEVIAGKDGINRWITSKMLSRPGIELAGLFDFYEEDRIQIIGSKEVTFFNRLNEDEQEKRVEQLFKEKTPCFIFSNHFDIPQVFLNNADKYQIPILRSDKHTTPLMTDVQTYLAEELADSTNMHGVLVDVHGVGVLIRGKSGIGKSEAALELVKRGHKLIADDNVIIYEKEIGKLVGKSPKLIQKYMEIRGIGIVDVVQMFGAGAIRHKKEITLVVNLEIEPNSHEYDRLGVEEAKIKILNTEVPFITIPIRPGRNLATLIEVAAINRRLRYMGLNTAQQFIDNFNEYIQKKEENK